MTGTLTPRLQAIARIWRVAFLLTADADAATAITFATLGDQSRPHRIRPEFLDRLAVQHVRLWTARRPLPAPTESDPLHKRILAMPPQAAQAWLLASVLGLDGPDLARAMDCSNTAAAAHLQRARDWLAEHFDADTIERAAAEIGRAVFDADPMVHYHAHRTRRLRRRCILSAVVLLLVLLLAVALA